MGRDPCSTSAWSNWIERRKCSSRVLLVAYLISYFQCKATTHFLINLPWNTLSLCSLDFSHLAAAVLLSKNLGYVVSEHKWVAFSGSLPPCSASTMNARMPPTLLMGKTIAMHFSTAPLWFQPFVVLRSSRRELDTLPSLPTSAKIKQTVNTDASLSAEPAMLLLGGFIA